MKNGNAMTFSCFSIVSKRLKGTFFSNLDKRVSVFAVLSSRGRSPALILVLD